jgi:hypothetical protein
MLKLTCDLTAIRCLILRPVDRPLSKISPACTEVPTNSLLPGVQFMRLLKGALSVSTVTGRLRRRLY